MSPFQVARNFSLAAFFTVVSILSGGAAAVSQGKVESAPTEEIALTGGLSAPVARVGDNIHVWISFHNKTANSIFDIRVIALRAQGYEIVRLSWCPQHTRSTGDSNLTKCPVVAAELKPSQIVTATGELLAIAKHEKQNFSALVGWSSASKIRSELAVLLGENVTFGKLGFPVLRESVKDFALPLVLVLLGIAYQIFDKKREHSRQNEERRRDEAQHEQERMRAEMRQNQERELTQIAQTWNSMLPESHRLATNYYMPVQASANEALQRLKKLDQDKASRSEEDKFHAFFFLVLFERQMRQLIKKAGGFYFKDRVGEVLVTECYSRYRSLYYWGHGKGSKWNTFSRMLDCISIDETIASFSKKFEHREDDKAKEVEQVLTAGRKEFDAWLDSKDCVDATVYLNGFATLLGYEMNRPYQYWYGQPEKVLLDSETESMLKLVGRELPYPGFSEQVNQYLELGKM